MLSRFGKAIDFATVFFEDAQGNQHIECVIDSPFNILFVLTLNHL